MVDILAAPVLTRRRFTVDEYHRMAEAGILHEDDRIELIDGELVEMAAIGSRHAASVSRTAKAFMFGLGDRAVVSVQNPVRLSSHSEPQPDLLVLRPRADFYEDALPDPGDVLLIIEISDTILAYDRGYKLPRYALAGIPEVWIADLQLRRVLVHRQPQGDMFREALIVDQGTLSPLAFPDLVIQLTQIFR